MDPWEDWLDEELEQMGEEDPDEDRMIEDDLDGDFDYLFFAYGDPDEKGEDWI